ncbi:GntR family transcriptional regulator [Elioraea sp.]|uniref:GntR family transcriptional regulator n=1 Tax=Elioraea sp. TaxID=2185103 RepID=UPI003F6EA425
MGTKDETIERRRRGRPSEATCQVAVDDGRRIERSMLSTQVSTKIIEGLLAGRLRPGDRLVETDLADQLGVSRSPIREALSELAQSGVIIREPGRGGRIRQWTRRDLEDLYGVRFVLEGYAVRLAMPRMTAADEVEFSAVIEAMRRAATADDYMEMIELDLAFHQVLWRISGNRLLEQVLQGLSQQFRLFLTMNWRFHGGLEDVAENHVKLLGALRSGNAEQGDAAMREHVVVERMTKALHAHEEAMAGARSEAR